ncbi:HEAT repeat domain-containing protein [bacterium]|nr:MAG: HEAT repeat domain-containing protein [bacterium]
MNCSRKYRQRDGEQKVCRSDVDELIRLSRSEDDADRLVAAELLCPCHVRAKVPDAWAALFRLMEDSHPKVRFAAWHTLEDGGDLSDPAVEPIAERVLQYGQNAFVRKMALQVAQRARDRTAHLQASSVLSVKKRGKCDFCGGTNVLVEPDYTTTVGAGDNARAALTCSACRV